jgi:hypothetical protein
MVQVKISINRQFMWRTIHFQLRKLASAIFHVFIWRTYAKDREYYTGPTPLLNNIDASQGDWLQHKRQPTENELNPK